MSSCKAPEKTPLGWEKIYIRGSEAIIYSDKGGLKIAYSIEEFDGSEEDCPPMGEGKYSHISFSRQNKYPGWDEMRDWIYDPCMSDWFDRERDVVMFLPPKERYVNVHTNCFHFYQKVINSLSTGVDK